jgi:hypothetical protein
MTIWCELPCSVICSIPGNKSFFLCAPSGYLSLTAHTPCSFTVLYSIVTAVIYKDLSGVGGEGGGACPRCLCANVNERRAIVRGGVQSKERNDTSDGGEGSERSLM